MTERVPASWADIQNIGAAALRRDGYFECECECGSGLPAKFWTGDGWMCGECYDEREAAIEATS